MPFLGHKARKLNHFPTTKIESVRDNADRKNYESLLNEEYILILWSEFNQREATPTGIF